MIDLKDIFLKIDENIKFLIGGKVEYTFFIILTIYSILKLIFQFNEIIIKKKKKVFYYLEKSILQFYHY